MKMSSMVGVCSAMALCLAVGTAQAGPNPGAAKTRKAQKATKVAPKKQLAQPVQGRRVDPFKVAGIKKLANGKYQMTTDWMPYKGGAGNDEPTELFYDSAQVDDTGFPIGGTECGLPGDGYRWLLECNAGQADFNNPYAAWWMQIADAHAGKEAAKATMHWYWTQAGNGTFYVAVFTSEDVSEDCSLPSTSNEYAGVVLGFNDNLGSGYFYTVFDGTPYDLFWTMPADGRGGIIHIIADFFDGETLTLAAGPTQPMLYGTSNNGGIPDRPGESGDPTWSDDGGACPSDPDGEHTDNECYTYAFGVCPDPLTNMIAFWGEPAGDECYPDCNGDTVLDLFDFLCFVNDFNILAPYANCNGDGAHDLFDFLCFVNAFNTGC